MIYIPPNCYTLDKATAKQQTRLGIQGYGGTGKTWAALTFPNPIVLNLDKGLKAHQGRKDVVEIPFFDSKFCKYLHDMKDKLAEWLETEAQKIEAEQTLIVDGCTTLQNAYHAWFEINKTSFLTKAGKIDDFAEWQVKKKYFGQIMEGLKSLKCDVILLAHESERADKPTTVGQPGLYTGKIRPLLTGAFGDEILGYFTDWFRQKACEKPDVSQITEATLSNWKMTKLEFQAMLNTFSGHTLYYWTTESDDVFDAKASSLVDFPKFMPANFSSFNKYVRKIQTTN